MFRSHRRGLTPSETLLVAAVTVAVVLALFWRFTGDPGVERRRVTIARVNTVMGALEKYAIDNGAVFPTTEQGLRALLVAPDQEPRPVNWRGPYLQDEQALEDGWGVPLQYVSPGNDKRPYDLWSNGADQREGGTDADADVQSWNRTTLIP